MKRILVLGAGGSASTNFVRSLRLAPEKFYLIGVDCNKYYLQRAETELKYLGVSADDKNYIPILNKIIEMTGAEFVHAQNDAEVYAISENREKLKCKTFFPSHNTVTICQNKYLSNLLWHRAGFKRPKTFLIDNGEELVVAYKEIQGEMWIRDIQGAGGKGSLKTGKFEVARNWIEYNNGWGHYTVAEYLSEQSTTWSSIWEDGELIVGQGRKRLYWELGPAFISGVSGATGGGITEDNPIVVWNAIKAIQAIDKKPHGIYSVDLTYGQDGIPYPTEINIGRFFTTHYFFSKAGLNLPYIYVKLAYEEEIPHTEMINPLPNDLVWIRGMDFEPILTTMDKIKEGGRNEIQIGRI